jgi:hypothetical protein
MKHLPGLVLLVGIVGVSQTFAADPPAAGTTQPAPSEQAAPLAPAPMAAGPTVESTASQPSPVAANSPSGTASADTPATDDPAAKAAAAKAEEKKYRNKGYKPHVVKGETQWCKEEYPVGSRIPSMTCYTVAQMEWQEQQGQDTLRDIQRLNTGTQTGALGH